MWNKTKAERLALRESYLTGYQRQEFPELETLVATQENNGRFYLLIFDGTSGRPTINWVFSSAEQRKQAIDKHINDRKKSIAYREDRKKEKKTAGKYAIDTSKPHFEVGEEYSMTYYNDDPWAHTCIMKVINRTTRFVTVEMHNSTTRVKVSADEKGEYLSWGSFYYFRASAHCLDAKEQAELEAAEEAEKESAVQERITYEKKELEKIKDIISENPVPESDKYTIKIEWCEGLIELADYMENRVISIGAAEKIFCMVDSERASRKDYGYDKWKFNILERGNEAPVWVDRYDMGNNNGGLIKWMNRYRDSKGAEFGAMVGELERLVSGCAEKILDVSFAPWVLEAMEQRKERAAQDFNAIMDLVGMLTDSQIADAVLKIPYHDKDKADIARFFLQELERRDTGKALSVFRAWRNGGTIDDIEL